MVELEKDWQFGALGIYNLKKQGSFSNLLSFIEKNHDQISGDIVELGVYKGHSLISIAYLLKKLGSNKKVFGFDSFEGFPPVFHANDSFDAFKMLYESGNLKQSHYEDVLQNNEILRQVRKIESKSSETISTSGTFKDTNQALIQAKLDYLHLDNVELIKGNFSDTLSGSSKPEKIMAAVIDCDLYASYLDAFDFIWGRLADGGFIHLDEYYSLKFPGARIATNEFISGNPTAELHITQSSDQDFERSYIIKNCQ